MKINYKIIRDQDFLKAQPTVKFFFWTKRMKLASGFRNLPSKFDHRKYNEK